MKRCVLSANLSFSDWSLSPSSPAFSSASHTNVPCLDIAYQKLACFIRRPAVPPHQRRPPVSAPPAAAVPLHSHRRPTASLIQHIDQVKMPLNAYAALRVFRLAGNALAAAASAEFWLAAAQSDTSLAICFGDDAQFLLPVE